jgi:hypothetical protein
MGENGFWYFCRNNRTLSRKGNNLEKYRGGKAHPINKTFIQFCTLYHLFPLLAKGKIPEPKEFGLWDQGPAARIPHLSLTTSGKN